MTELSSLFAKIKIKKENLERFLESKPTVPALTDDWMQWWDSRDMHGKRSLTVHDLRCYSYSTNAEIINAWKNNEESGTFSDYDTENEIWHFGIIFFSENFAEMIPGLIFIRSVAPYKEINPGDFAIIYDFFWGDGYVSSFVNYIANESFLDPRISSLEDINEQLVEYASNYLNKKAEEFGSEFEE